MGSLKFGIKQICLLIVQRGLDIEGVNMAVMRLNWYNLLIGVIFLARTHSRSMGGASYGGKGEADSPSGTF
jgi:hypothetical protein